MVRPRTDDDLDACEQLAQAVHQADGYPVWLGSGLRDFISAPEALAAWVAVDDAAQVVGHVVLNPRTSPGAMALAGEASGLAADELVVVARLLVAPAARRAGVASALLDHAVDAARRRQRRPMIDVVTRFAAAITVYERRGWVRVGQASMPIPDADPLEMYVYVLPF